MQNGQILDKNNGVLKVTLITGPQLYPQSAASVNAAQQYYCLALDIKGFQVQIDLQAMPPGVTLSQLQSNQVWWVEKRTTQYRLYLYGGIYDPSIRQVVSTSGLIISPNGDLNGTYNIPIVTGLQGIPVVSGQPTVGQTLTYTTSGWSPATPSVATGVPTGTLLDFAGATPPTGYLLCDGSSYSTTTYSGLFSTISYTWGGSGSSFNVPDLRGRTTIGAGSGTGLTFRTLATYSGEENHVLVSGETPLAAHTHTFTVPSSTGTTATGTSSSVSLSIPASTYNTVSNTTGIGVSSSVGTLTAAGGTGSVTDPGHTHSPSNTTMIGQVTNATALGNGVGTGGGYKYVGLYQDGAVPVIQGGSKTTGITVSFGNSNVTGTITSSVSDPGHVHSIPTMTVTGSVAIPGLSFTVPAQTGLTTSGNAATTASGHNNMQPYAVVTKIIKY